VTARLTYLDSIGHVSECDLDRVNVHGDLFAVFSASGVSALTLTASIAQAVAAYRACFPSDEGARIVEWVKEEDALEEEFYEVQFNSRTKPRWQKMVVSPFANSKEIV
jgi:hypothetical protein